MNRGRAVCLAALGVVLVVLLGGACWSDSFAAAPSGATYVGSDACKQCHETHATKFMSSPHGRASMDGSVLVKDVSCESCHGPGSLHVNAGGDTKDPGFATIMNPKNQAAAQVNETCTSCHKGGDQMQWQHAKHAKKGVSCLSCHSVHSPAEDAVNPLLTKSDVNAICFSCHDDKKAQFAKSAHMPLHDPTMNCTSCHNPHGSDGPKAIRAASANELCYKCHADKRGPFLFDHAPVRENCLNCHDAHGSNNDKLLVAKRPYLCQECHVGGRHPATLYDRQDLASNRLYNRSCTNCHSQVHGSNSPTGRYFLR